MRFFVTVALICLLPGCQDTSDWGKSTPEKLDTRPIPDTPEEIARECDWIDEERELVRSTLSVASAQSSAITSASVKQRMRENAEYDLEILEEYERGIGCHRLPK